MIPRKVLGIYLFNNKYNRKKKENTAKAMNITRAGLAQIFCFKRGNLDRRIILRNPCKMTVKSLLTSRFRPTLSRFRPTNP